MENKFKDWFNREKLCDFNCTEAGTCTEQCDNRYKTGWDACLGILKVKELEKDRNMWKKLTKQLEERLVKALRENKELIEQCKKCRNETTEIIHDLYGDIAVMKKEIKDKIKEFK